ncbi:hypothetical protein [Deinococcus kurensis]|uniref:hypothetical protein n=1 Tax=Deinococcus kurensis TaxID=2662757 RepID=UPI00192E67CA|nr:hypothetical protein [Deinococcus kurensis]
MSSVPAPMCLSCRHLMAGTLTCAAYPDGIPEEILDSEIDHRKPYDRDNGVQFEPLPGHTADELDLD